MGFSVLALISVVSTVSRYRTASKAGPCTWGTPAGRKGPESGAQAWAAAVRSSNRRISDAQYARAGWLAFSRTVVAYGSGGAPRSASDRQGGNSVAGTQQLAQLHSDQDRLRQRGRVAAHEAQRLTSPEALDASKIPSPSASTRSSSAHRRNRVPMAPSVAGSTQRRSSATATDPGEPPGPPSRELVELAPAAWPETSGGAISSPTPPAWLAYYCSRHQRCLP